MISDILLLFAVKFTNKKVHHPVKVLKSAIKKIRFGRLDYLSFASLHPGE